MPHNFLTLVILIRVKMGPVGSYICKLSLQLVSCLRKISYAFVVECVTGAGL